MAIGLRPTAGWLRRGGFGWAFPAAPPQGRHRAPAAGTAARRRWDAFHYNTGQRSHGGTRGPLRRGRHHRPPLPPPWRRKAWAQARRERAVLAYIDRQRRPARLKDRPLGRSLYRRPNEGVRASTLYRGTDADHVRQQFKPMARDRAKTWHGSSAERHGAWRHGKSPRRFGSNVIWPRGQRVDWKVKAGATGALASAVSDAHLPGAGALAGAASKSGSGSNGGSGMSDIGSAKANMGESDNSLESALAACQEALQEVEAAAQSQATAAEDSERDDVEERRAALEKMQELVSEAVDVGNGATGLADDIQSNW